MVHGKVMIIPYKFFGRTSSSSTYIDSTLPNSRDSTIFHILLVLRFMVKISKNSDNLPFKENSKFWSMMKLYINPKELNKAIKIATENLDSQNWISTLYMTYMFLVDTTSKLGKQFYGSLKEFRESRKIK